ncbi:MAG: alpha/beta hydrolase [Anaerolineales bacterium]|jgi:pimeloyl-ACP methyl ester carboxylesterase|nr:alpha/beta hydrolase [Anaerolineales bacterium]
MPVAEALYYHLNQGAETDLPVVLLHGAGGMHLSWPTEIRRLTGCRVFALDLPGHGRSNHVGGLQSVEAYAQSVQSWLEAVGLYRVVILGHSMGGAIAMQMACQFPKQVLGIGLISTGPRLPVPPDLLAAAANSTTFYKAREILASISFGANASPRLVEMVGKRLSEMRPSVLHGDLIACDRFDASTLVDKIQCPALVVCGVEDQLTPLRSSQFLAVKIPNAQLVTIQNAGHIVMLEQPQAVAAALAAFLQGMPK